jgi:sulfur carrier protein
MSAPAQGLTVRLNGKDTAVAAVTVAALLAEVGIDAGRRGVAVALNGAVVRRAEWAWAPVASGDTLEIVQPLQGG